jgi:apolipoprotein N-acyltransferase
MDVAVVLGVSLLPAWNPFRVSLRALGAGAASGLLLALALVPEGAGGWAFVALVPLLAFLDRAPPLRAALHAGFGCGLALFLVGGAWVPFAGPGTVGLVATYVVWAPVLALPIAGFALAVAWLRRFGRTTFLLAVPTVWVTTEFLRCSSELGSQYHLGYSLADHPAWIQLASLGGVHLVSLWIAAVNAALLALVAAPRRAAPAFLALLGLPLAFGAVALRTPGQAARGRSIAVAGVQPAVAARARHVPALFDDHLRELLALSKQTLGDRPDLIVWPESAFERASPEAGPPFLGAIAHHFGTPLLSGVWRFVVGPPPVLRNSSVLATPDGAVGIASDKVNPIWVYESAPASAFGLHLARAGIWPGRFGRGEKPDVLLLPGTPAPIHLGVLVCVDTTYPALARDLRRRGAEFLVLIANEADSGPWTRGLEARIARLRAVENGVPLVRIANTGPSEWVDAKGRVVASLRPDAPQARTANLELGEKAPLYTRAGDTPTALVAIAAPGVLAAQSIARNRRRARRPRVGIPLSPRKENQR